jgi:hypothetical protein
MFIYVAGSLSDGFSMANVSFEESLGSDHAAVYVTWHPLDALPSVPAAAVPGFALEDELASSWSKDFPRRAFPAPLISSLS